MRFSTEIFENFFAVSKFCVRNRLRSKNFAAAKIKFLRKFRSEIHRKSHEISRAAACRRTAQCLETSKARGRAVRRQSQGIWARSCADSDAKFCTREELLKISIENPKSHAIISRAAACRRSAQLLGTSEGRKRAAHYQAACISARSQAIANAKFCGREIFSKFSVRNPFRIAQNLTRHSMPTLRTAVQDLSGS